MGILSLDDLSKLTDYVSTDQHVIRPGCYFVAHGQGPAMMAIRTFTQSWAGHAGIYVGNGRIVEGMPPVALNSSVSSHPLARFNYREGRELTDEQRLAIINKAFDLVGTHYDFDAYLGFLGELFNIRTQKGRDNRFDSKHRICSALVADCYWAAGIDLDPFASIVNLISPADLYNRIVTY